MSQPKEISVPGAARAGLWRQLAARRSFVIAALVLGFFALSFNFAVSALRVTFRKEAVPPRAPMADLPERLGSWMRVWKDDTLAADMEEALQTRDYLFGEYVNLAAVGLTAEALTAELKNRSNRERLEYLYRLQQQNPAAVIKLGLTYYTGKADTVAHIPERCYVGGGYSTETASSEEWSIGGRGRMPVRYLSFGGQAGLRMERANVAYLFHVNGRYESSSLRVRAALQNLFARHAYYAKVELMNAVPDREEGARAMREFLSAAIPEIEKLLPDWSRYGS